MYEIRCWTDETHPIPHLTQMYAGDLYYFYFLINFGQYQFKIYQMPPDHIPFFGTLCRIIIINKQNRL